MNSGRGKNKQRRAFVHGCKMFYLIIHWEQKFETGMMDRSIDLSSSNKSVYFYRNIPKYLTEKSDNGEVKLLIIRITIPTLK